MLQAAVGVNSAFERWSSHVDDAIYGLLMALHQEDANMELECTCTRGQLCFLHHPEEELSKHLYQPLTWQWGCPPPTTGNSAG